MEPDLSSISSEAVTVITIGAVSYLIFGEDCLISYLPGSIREAPWKGCFRLHENGKSQDYSNERHWYRNSVFL